MSKKKSGKIKTRKAILKEYNNDYAQIETDDCLRLTNYMNSTFKYNDLPRLGEMIYKLKTEEEYEEVSFILYEYPMKYHRHRVEWKTRRLYSPNAKENHDFFEGIFGDLVQMKTKIICTPCIIDIKCYFPVPKNFNKFETVLAEMELVEYIKTPDFDNLGKSYCDMQNMITFLDDSLVIDGRIRKFYSLKPRVEINIKYKKKHSIKKNYQSIVNSILFEKYRDSVEIDYILKGV
jgi:Holliday junction resolvase RusA-like endonuclease